MPDDPMPDDSGHDHYRQRFDEIVDGLELELPDDLQPEDLELDDPEPDDWEALRPSPRRTPPASEIPPELRPDPEEVFDALPDEPFYRQAPPVRWDTGGRAGTAAWSAVLGAPSLLVLCTFLQIWLPRPLVVAAGFTFVAGAIYLFSQLPSRGPRDGPDGGAVL